MSFFSQASASAIYSCASCARVLFGNERRTCRTPGSRASSCRRCNHPTRRRTAAEAERRLRRRAALPRGRRSARRRCAGRGIGADGRWRTAPGSGIAWRIDSSSCVIVPRRTLSRRPSHGRRGCRQTCVHLDFAVRKGLRSSDVCSSMRELTALSASPSRSSAPAAAVSAPAACGIRHHLLMLAIGCGRARG